MTTAFVSTTERSSESPGAGQGGVEEIAPFFDPMLVVSRDGAGQPVSRYGEPRWIYTSQSTDATTERALAFFSPDDGDDRQLAAVVTEQHKALIWVHMDAGPVLALQTVMATHYAALAWCKWAYARRLDLFTVLANPELVAEGCQSMNVTYVVQTVSLVRTLCRQRELLRVDNIPLQQLKARIVSEADSRPEDRQTPLIPSRIYSAILSGMLNGCDEIESSLDTLLDAYHRSMAASREAPANVGKYRRYLARSQSLVDVVQRMNGFGYDSASRSLDRFIAGQLNRRQALLMHTVAAFTGMRRSEILILPAEGVLKTFNHRGTLHYEVHGYTHKLNSGMKEPATWITSQEGARAIRLAQRIALAVQQERGKEARAGQAALLFPSTENPYKHKSPSSLTTYQDRLIEQICPEICQSDIDELDRMELDRGWQRDDIVVGRRWPLAYHQLRRSLSVYAHRSGMVSLPSLKAQLQHVTDEMRSYYSDGYCRAVNMVYDPGHFSHDWSAGAAESSYFGYVIGLLFNDDELLGEGAVRMNQVVSSHSRLETLQLFQKGRLAYRETVLGGCAAVEECKSQPLEPIPFDCLTTNCVNLVVTSKRLDMVIQSQKSVVAVLGRESEGSVEHRLEAGNLETLLKAQRTLKAARR